jgi:hypothetical protein
LAFSDSQAVVSRLGRSRRYRTVELLNASAAPEQYLAVLARLDQLGGRNVDNGRKLARQVWAQYERVALLKHVDGGGVLHVQRLPLELVLQRDAVVIGENDVAQSRMPLE